MTDVRPADQSRSRSLAWHLTVLGLGLVVPAFLFTGILFVQYSLSESERLKERTRTVARTLAVAVDREVANISTTLDALALSPSLQRGDLDEFYRHAQEVHRRQRFHVTLRDPEGVGIVSTRLPMGARLTGNPPELKAADAYAVATGRPYTSDLMTGVITGQPALHLIVPTRVSGAAGWVVSASFQPDFLSPTLERMALPAGWSAGIIDRRGLQIVRVPALDGVVGQPTRWTYQDDAGSFTATNGDGVSAFFAYDTSQAGWRVIVAIPTASLEAPVTRSVGTLLGLGAALGMLTLILTRITGRRILTAMSVVNAAARRIGRGEIASVAATPVTEINTIGAALREASNDLARRAEERDRVLAALRESELRYRTLHESMRDPFVQTDMTGRIVAHNDLYAEMLGYTAEELRNLTYRDLTPETWHAAEETIVQEQILRRGYSDVYEKEYRRKDGTVIPVELRTVLGRDAKGRPNAMWAIVREVGARKRAERELRLANERFRLALAAAPITVFAQDRTLRYTWVNSAVYGCAADTVIGKRDAEILERAEDAAVLDALKTRVITTGIGERHEVEVTWQGVAWCYDLLVEPLRDPGGTIGGVICAAIEITERKRAEQELSQSQRFETFSRIAGGIAHDFNNLLSVVAGNLELVETREAPDDVRRAIATSLSAIRDGATLSRRMQQILSAGRRRTPVRERLVVSERVKTAARLLEHTVGPAVTLRTEIAPDLWPVVVDPGEIDSVLFNLALNAREAMPAGGTLTIAVANVVVTPGSPELRDGAAPGDHVRLSVTDSGVGMPPEILRRIGEPFFSTKRLGQGTGLGLASVFGFVRDAGGFVAVTSAPGAGTCVSLYLPRAAATAEIETGPSEPVPTGDGELVLVVEDDERVRQVSLRRLEMLGYAVLEARDTADALAQIRAGEPVDLVFSDISMPGASGYDLAATLRAEHPTIPVLLTTGFEPGDPRRDDSRAPAGVAILEKPYSMARLARAVAAALHPTPHVAQDQPVETSPVNT
ncbi:PAS domain S-box protein [Rhodoplanes sp. SY1]|uniref:PAS domain S-box protein n=1 Tax=Rhodoplanes sp. SY1 TaxID=3166646 RepID=UPI0038B645EA